MNPGSTPCPFQLERHISSPLRSHWGGRNPTWSPTTQQWKTGHSTVKATDTVQNTDVTIGQSSAPVTHDIAVDYLPLNYGPTDFSYELWHYGPIFSSKQNVVLVHGINVWTPRRFLSWVRLRERLS